MDVQKPNSSAPCCVQQFVAFADNDMLKYVPAQGEVIITVTPKGCGLNV